MTTYPKPSDPVNAFTRADGRTSPHSDDHGQIIDLLHNVRHYGAKGDGVADDAPAIRLAIVDANAFGGSVFFPAGRYKVGSTIDISPYKYLHFLGGSHGDLGSPLQFIMGPYVTIDGSAMASGPAFRYHGDGSGGSHTLENIVFLGKDNGFDIKDSARWRFNNCGFKSTSTTATNRAGLKIENSFWFTFRDSTFHNRGSAPGEPAIVLKGSAPVNASGVGLLYFEHCLWAGGAIDYQIDYVPPQDVGNIFFDDCFTEGVDDPWITFRETSALGSNYSIIGLHFEDCSIADAGVGSVPFVYLNASAHAFMRMPRFTNCDAPGHVMVSVVSGKGAVIGAQVMGNNQNTISDSVTGDPTGDWIRHKHQGLAIAGNAELGTFATTNMHGQSGPSLLLGKSNDKWASIGIDPGTGATSGLLFGSGGTGVGDPGWDTNLYREAADTLKTDDTLHVGATLAAVSLVQTQVNLTDGANVAVNAATGNVFYLLAGAGRTIGAPTNPLKGMVVTFIIANNSGGAMTTTWNGIFHLAGAWVDPANGKFRTITFVYIDRPANTSLWLEVSRAAADIT